MPGINDALLQIAKLKPGEKVSYKKIAKNECCSRTTLSRRHQGKQVARATKNVNQQKITPQQEANLLQYIIGLTGRRFLPTRQLIKNFVRGIASVEVSKT